MAPSTPPPPSNARLAAFTIASTVRVVMSATMISSCAAPIPATSSLMPAILSRVLRLRHGVDVDARPHANVAIVGVEETPRRALAVGAQHIEEIVVGVEAARS